ncbi:MAG: MFS transporter [Bacteroidetes bacterium]|nr:MFS transporter [Bacteroidota bacterium]MDA1118891.1 MFS transporter [Bacteroidota bacterium]
MKKNYTIVGLIFLIFFVISFITNILNSILPNIKDSFDLSLGLSGFLPFSFFVAYGFMSIPAGILIEKYGEKRVMIISFLVALLGAFLFASFPSFQVALPSLFLIGIGMAMLQVAINPLLRITGGESNFAFFSVMAQLIFGAASAISPYVYSYLIENLNEYSGGGGVLLDTLSKLVPPEMSWVSLYWIFLAVLLIIIIIVAVIKFEKVDLAEDEKSGAIQTHVQLLKNRYVVLFFIGIFAYVGTEQGVGNWISEFLKQYHNYNPEIQGAQTVSNFWLLLTIGCFLGLILLKIFDSRKILIAFSTAAIISLAVALFGSGAMALIAFPIVGFSSSVLWSIIFSLALNSVPKNHGSFSGILCTGIVGGAIVPLIIGTLGDFVGLKFAMTFLFLTLGYILSIGFWAKPLITNNTINFKKD